MKKSIEINPSSMTRIVNCPISHKFDEVSYYDPETNYDRRPVLGCDQVSKGIIAHRYAAAVMNEDDEELINIATYPGFSEKIEENVMDYVAFCYDLIPPADQEPKLKVECDLNLDFIYSGCFGRADCVIDARDDLFIIDLKYGNYDVDAQGCYQLLAYAIGAENESDRKHSNIHILIYNAFQGYSSRWDITRAEASNQAEYIKKRVNEAMTNPINFSAGPWCDTCKHRDECSCWMSMVTAEALSDGVEMTSDDWDKCAVWLIGRGKKGYRDTINDNVIKKINEGTLTTKRLEKKETQKWDAGRVNAAIQELRELGYADHEIFETSLLSPSQLRKRLGAIPEIEEVIKRNSKTSVRNTIKNK